MDKRTLLSVIGFAIILFCVNMFFDYQHQETLKEWTEQHQAKLSLQIQDLEKQIASKNSQIKNAVNVTTVYDSTDENAKALTTALRIDDETLLLLSPTANAPKEIFTKNSSNPTLSYTLRSGTSLPNEPLIYSQQEHPQILTNNISFMGKYDVIVFTPNDNSSNYNVLWGEFIDGQLSLPQDKLQGLIAAKNNTTAPKPLLNSINAIVLQNVDGKHLPIAYYDHSQGGPLLLSSLSDLRPFLKMAPSPFGTIANNGKKEEQFFVLQTNYQQFVFSNVGGALVEINLPFQTESNPQSVVKEIQFDRDMVQDHPYNSYFPQHPYSIANAEGVIEQKTGQLGGYYPLLRRSLIESGRRPSIKLLPRYYALNIVSEYPEVAELVFEVKRFDDKSIVFEAVQPHRRITKTYTLADNAAPYTFNLAIKIEGDDRGLWLSTGIPEVEWISGASAPMQKYRYKRQNNADVELIKLPSDALTNSTVNVDWICNSNGFFGIILDPLSTIPAGFRSQFVSGATVPSRLVEIDEDSEKFPAQNMPGYLALLPLSGSQGEVNFRIFAGPFDDAILKQVDATYANPATGYNPDYIACQSFHGWFSFISEPFAKFLYVLLKFFYQLTGSWAFSIVLLTIALRIMLYPLNAWSTKSMIKMRMIAPQVQAIQEKYKKDPTKAQLEIMNLYRESGVNPISGCFPMLIQIPFLMGMFDLLKSSFVLRGAEFIPGWIDDLTAPDVLFRWNTPIFFIGNEFHLLPILLGATMFLQQKLMTAGPKDPNQMTEQQRQQQVMGNMMSVVFTVMFYNFPSGLNIYWLSSMLLGILQQWWTEKRMGLRP